MYYPACLIWLYTNQASINAEIQSGCTLVSINQNAPRRLSTRGVFCFLIGGAMKSIPKGTPWLTIVVAAWHVSLKIKEICIPET